MDLHYLKGFKLCSKEAWSSEVRKEVVNVIKNDVNSALIHVGYVTMKKAAAMISQRHHDPTAA